VPANTLLCERTHCAQHYLQLALRDCVKSPCVQGRHRKATATFDHAPELRRADTDCALIESTSTALQATRLQLTS
jgi:hypothetical protein